MESFESKGIAEGGCVIKLEDFEKEGEYRQSGGCGTIRGEAEWDIPTEIEHTAESNGQDWSASVARSGLGFAATVRRLEQESEES